MSSARPNHHGNKVSGTDTDLFNTNRFRSSRQTRSTMGRSNGCLKQWMMASRWTEVWKCTKRSLEMVPQAWESATWLPFLTLEDDGWRALWIKTSVLWWKPSSGRGIIYRSTWFRNQPWKHPNHGPLQAAVMLLSRGGGKETLTGASRCMKRNIEICSMVLSSRS